MFFFSFINEVFNNAVYSMFAIFNRLFGVCIPLIGCSCCKDDSDVVSYKCEDLDDFRNPEDREEYLRKMKKTIKAQQMSEDGQRGCSCVRPQTLS